MILGTRPLNLFVSTAQREVRPIFERLHPIFTGEWIPDGPFGLLFAPSGTGPQGLTSTTDGTGAHHPAHNGGLPPGQGPRSHIPGANAYDPTCVNGVIASAGGARRRHTFLDLIPAPPRPGDPGFSEFADAIVNKDDSGPFAFWVHFMESGGDPLGNADCIPLLLDGMDRPPLWFGTAKAFWHAYGGDDVSQFDAISRLRDFWDRMCRCSPPPIKNADEPLFISSHGEPVDGLFNVVQTGFTCPGVDVDAELSRAMATIRANFDIVQWLACILDPRLADCLADYLMDANDHRTIHLDVGSWGARTVGKDDGTSGFTAAVTLEETSGCRMRINSRVLCHEFLEPLKNGASANDRVCAMIEMSAWLLHESVHCCATETHFHDRTTTTDDADACSNAHLIQHMFKWCMAHRHACSQFKRDSDFLSDS